MTKSRDINRPRHVWSAWEVQLLRDNYADSLTADLATVLNMPIYLVYAKANNMGLKKSDAFNATDKSGRMLKGGSLSVATQFKPGVSSWSKGTRGVVGVQEGCRATQFKKGNRPQTYRYDIGDHRIEPKDKYLMRKVSELNRGNLDWRFVHRLVWEEAHGPVPAGMVVCFKRGLWTNVLEQITLDRLECITRKELMARNTVHNLGPELARVVQLRGALNRQINRRSKEQ